MKDYMTGKTHQILGISTAMVYFLTLADHHYNPATFGTVLVFSCVAALLPDIDQSNSKLWHLLPFGDTAGKMSDPFLKHRNITHSFLGLGIVGLGFHYLLSAFPAYWGIDTNLVFNAAMLAYASHLFADMFTNEGIPLLFPYKNFFGLPPKPFEGARIATGKWFENLVVFPSITIFIIIFTILNQQIIKTILFK